MKASKIKGIVKDGYARIAKSSSGCGSENSCCGQRNTSRDISESIGYSGKQMDAVPDGSNLGLGCGNPTAMGELKKGETVLDLGSGAGFDAFLAANKVGKKGKVIGVDMTKEMIEKARANTKKNNYNNVEFRLGDIEDLPVDDGSIDVVISNCVINLAPDKRKVFKEAFRVLKKGGRMYASDIVLLKKLSKEQREDSDLIAGCVGGAILKDEYIANLKEAGFKVKVVLEDRDIAKRQYESMPVQSLSFVAVKNGVK